MAEVTSGAKTIIVLDDDEAKALADMLWVSCQPSDYPVLDDLMYAMCGIETDTTEDTKRATFRNWDKPEPPWKDEPTSDYRVAE